MRYAKPAFRIPRFASRVSHNALYMHLDKWQEIKEKVLNDFEVHDQGNEKNEERLEDIEYLEFIGPMGRMRLEWISRPKVLDKKTQYSRRIGGDVSVDYVYSENEITYTFKVYKWSDVRDDWQEISARGFE